MKLRKAEVKDILKITFPEYKGRKFRLHYQEKYYMENYWSGGSKTYVKALMLMEDGKWKVSNPSELSTNPWKPQAHAEFDIPKNVIMVEHIYFCGKDMGISIVMHPSSEFVQKLLGE